MPIQETFDSYAALQAIINDCEEKMAVLKPEIVAYFSDGAIDNVPVESGKFSKRVTRTYNFTDKYKSMDKAVKNQKALEVAEVGQPGGAVLVSETVGFAYTPTKIK
jgi:hypothetical protein